MGAVDQRVDDYSHERARASNSRLSDSIPLLQNVRLLEPLVVTAFFSLFSVILTWPWALHMGEAINPFGDVVVQMTSMAWNAHAVTTDPLRLFEAPFFYPY